MSIPNFLGARIVVLYEHNDHAINRLWVVICLHCVTLSHRYIIAETSVNYEGSRVSSLANHQASNPVSVELRVCVTV